MLLSPLDASFAGDLYPQLIDAYKIDAWLCVGTTGGAFDIVELLETISNDWEKICKNYDSKTFNEPTPQQLIAKTEEEINKRIEIHFPNQSRFKLNPYESGNPDHYIYSQILKTNPHMHWLLDKISRYVKFKLLVEYNKGE